MIMVWCLGYISGFIVSSLAMLVLSSRSCLEGKFKALFLVSCCLLLLKGII